MIKNNNMKFNEKRNIFKKIDFFTFGFIFAIAVTIISSVSSIYFTLRISSSLKNMYEVDIAGANHIQKARFDLLNIENEQKTILLSDKDNDNKISITNIISYKNEFLNNMMEADPLFSSELGKKYFKDAKISADKYFNIIDNFLTNINNNNKYILISFKEASHAGVELDHKLDLLDNFKQRKNVNFYSNLIIIFQANLLIIVTVLLISTIIRIVLYINQKKHIKHL